MRSKSCKAVSRKSIADWANRRFWLDFGMPSGIGAVGDEHIGHKLDKKLVEMGMLGCCIGSFA